MILPPSACLPTPGSGTIVITSDGDESGEEQPPPRRAAGRSTAGPARQLLHAALAAADDDDFDDEMDFGDEIEDEGEVEDEDEADDGGNGFFAINWLMRYAMGAGAAALPPPPALAPPLLAPSRCRPANRPLDPETLVRAKARQPALPPLPHLPLQEFRTGPGGTLFCDKVRAVRALCVPRAEFRAPGRARRAVR